MSEMKWSWPAAAGTRSRSQETFFGSDLFLETCLNSWEEHLTFDYPGVVKETPHFTVKQEPGSFVLYIHKTDLSDAGVYYCIEQDQLAMKLLIGTFLKIKGK